ncbi:MAG: NADH-quinone oxidoreductase subunit NuoH [Dehalococcoidia bacterium]|nr:NADH-quinone oxidoreductase subunit NuoH [Dehalococcoidia bacterium]
MTLLEQFQLWLGSIWPGWAAYIVPAIVGIVVVLGFVLTMVIVFIWYERRLLGRFQVRLGPNRLGPEGIFQPIATAVKILLKEDIVPTKSDKVIHWLAPVIVFVPVLMIFAVVPFGERAILTDLNVGVVYVVAISSISAVGIYMAGWASNNKYGLISALRAVAQMVSYELPVVLAILGVVLMAGSLSMTQIVASQKIPFLLLQPLGFVIFFLGTVAEMNRSPFDLLEADSEIVAGYHIEYSGMKFAMFYLGEYGHALAYSCIIATLFLSGWQGPLLPPIIWLVIKVMAVFFVIVWMRSTLPRLRVDQLMAFAWKGLLPMAIINLFIVAAEVLWLSEITPWLMVAVNFVFAGVLVLLWSKLFTLGGGRVEV